MKHFGERLQELRLKTGLSQEALADAIEFNRSNYVRTEGGHRPASDLLLEKLAKFYNLPENQLKTEREAWKIYTQHTTTELAEALKFLDEDSLITLFLNMEEKTLNAVMERFMATGKRKSSAKKALKHNET